MVLSDSPSGLPAPFLPTSAACGPPLSRLILPYWHHPGASAPSTYSSWYSMSNSRSRLRPLTTHRAMTVSLFFLSRELFGVSVLPPAILYQPTASDFPSFSLHFTYFFPWFFLHILYVYWARLGFDMFLSFQECSPFVVRGLTANIGSLELLVSFVTCAWN